MKPLGILAEGKLGSASWLITNRWSGASEIPYHENNFAINVGDDPIAVAANRNSLVVQIDRSVIFPVACHSNTSVWVEKADFNNIENTDGLITKNRKIALAVLSADCATVLLNAKDLNLIAALHAGWKGMKDGILPKAISELKKAGTSEISAILGPAICADCYPVSSERFLEVKQSVPAAAVINKNQEYAIDVKAGLIAQLLEAQVEYESIAECSFESSDLYSFRRDERTGRNASVIWLNS